MSSVEQAGPAPPAASSAGGAERTGTAMARPVPGLWGSVAAILRKELLVELRTLESVPGMSLFSLSTFVVFHFALNRGSTEGDLASGILWVTLLFAAILGVNRLFVADADQGGFDGFLLAPVNRSALMIAKALTLLCFLLVLELIAVPAFALLLLGPPLGPALGGLALTLLLADLGVAAIGTLVGALAVHTRARDLLGPLLSLPLFVPIVIAGARCTAPLLELAHRSGPAARWLATLGLYDLIFGLIAYALFDFLLED